MELEDYTPSATTWLHTQRVQHEVVVRLGTQGGCLVAEFAGTGTLIASRNGTTHRFLPLPAADPVRVDKCMRSVGQALLRHLQGELTLHGSAVTYKGRALALLGESRAGKSTLATHLCMQPGVALLADDTVALDVATREVLPMQTQTWLLPDARIHLDGGRTQAKTPWQPTRLAQHPAPLAAGVVLTFGETFSLRRIQGGELLRVLQQSLFRFVLDRPEAYLCEFEQLTAVATTFPFFALCRPPSFAALDACTAALLQTFAAEVRSKACTQKS